MWHLAHSRTLVGKGSMTSPPQVYGEKGSQKQASISVFVVREFLFGSTDILLTVQGGPMIELMGQHVFQGMNLTQSMWLRYLDS